jgi:hypothetical protein
MAAPDTLRYAKIPLTHEYGAIPALGFGTLIPDPLATEQATKTALEVGFRHCGRFKLLLSPLQRASLALLARIEKREKEGSSVIQSTQPPCFGNEAKTSPVHRLDDSRLAGVLLQREPELPDRLTQGPGRDVGIRPHCIQELFYSHETARVLGEVAQYLPRLGP